MRTLNPISSSMFFAMKNTLAGRSASRRMKYGYHSRPKGIDDLKLDNVRLERHLFPGKPRRTKDFVMRSPSALEIICPLP